MVIAVASSYTLKVINYDIRKKYQNPYMPQYQQYQTGYQSEMFAQYTHHYSPTVQTISVQESTPPPPSGINPLGNGDHSPPTYVRQFHYTAFIFIYSGIRNSNVDQCYQYGWLGIRGPSPWNTSHWRDRWVSNPQVIKFIIAQTLIQARWVLLSIHHRLGRL